MKPIDWHDSKGRTCSHCKKWMQYPECPYESFQARHPGPNPDDEPCGQFYLNWYRTDEYMKGKAMENEMTRPAGQTLKIEQTRVVPTIGRVVHFWVDLLDDPRAAIVCGFDLEGDDAEPNLAILPARRGDAFDVIDEVPYSHVPKVGHWSWPPRV